MANHGLIIESQISADNTDALNRFAYSATTDFDGGALVELASPNVVGDDRYVASVPTATNGLWVAYNPADRHIDVEGRVFAGLIADDRVYTNLKGKTFTVFKPKAGVDLIDFTEDCVDATVSDAVVGDILESKAGQSKLTRIAKNTGATANHTAFVIESIRYADFPKAGIGVEKVKVFHCACIAE